MILQRILGSTRFRLAARKRLRPFEELEKCVLEAPEPLGFASALQLAPGGFGLIAELKPASPSAGVLRDPFVVTDLAQQFAAGGADCLSVLTEVEHFRGALDNLELAAPAQLPRLQKDFIVDAYQVLEGRVAGADAMLLIAEVVPPQSATSLCNLALDLGMDVLYEAHDPSNWDAVAAVAARAPHRILVGINNRDLESFEVDIGTTLRALDELPSDLRVIAESGIGDAAQVRRLRDAGAAGILVGESLLRQDDVAGAVRRLLQEVR